MIQTKPKLFTDKNGKRIKPEDTLYREFFARWRKFPGHQKVLSETTIISDEGELQEAEKHWVTYQIEWKGACLVAFRKNCSDFNTLLQAELFDEQGNRISEGSGFHYLNDMFDSSVYEIIE